MKKKNYIVVRVEGSLKERLTKDWLSKKGFASVSELVKYLLRRELEKEAL